DRARIRLAIVGMGDVVEAETAELVLGVTGQLAEAPVRADESPGCGIGLRDADRRELEQIAVLALALPQRPRYAGEFHGFPQPLGDDVDELDFLVAPAARRQHVHARERDEPPSL